jgi:hypothetical protein
VQHQFAEGAQDEEDEDSADGVHDEQAGSGAGEPSARAHEQARSDRATDGDHLQLPWLEALFVALFFVCEC